MCRKNTSRLRPSIWAAGMAALAMAGAMGQTLKTDWRRIGNSALDLSLAAVATGPMDRVWYSDSGDKLFAHNSAGRTFVTDDFESWTLVPVITIPPLIEETTAPVRPESTARVHTIRTGGRRLYAIGRFVYKSEDGGRNWANLTRYRDQSLLGNNLADLAVSPRDADDITIAGQSGVWRSVDGGLSWSGLNQSLPNIPVRRLMGFPLETRGVRIGIDAGGSVSMFEWMPGEKQAWRATSENTLATEAELKRSLSESLHAKITAVAYSAEYVYAGSSDGQLWVSPDGGRTGTWRKNPDTAAAPVEQSYIDQKDPRLALAALGNRLTDQPATARAILPG